MSQDEITSLSNKTETDVTLALFEQWAQEDAQMTEAQKIENDRIYSEIEKNGIPRVRF